MSDSEQPIPANPEMRALLMQADMLDSEVQASGPEAMVAEQEAAEVSQMTMDNVQGIMMMLGVAVPLLSKMYPSLEAVYTEEACASVASSVGPVLSKYGVSLGDMGGRYKEEITMVVVCWPIAAATVVAVKSDIAARAKPVDTQVPKAVASNSQKSAAPDDGYHFKEDRQPVTLG